MIIGQIKKTFSGFSSWRLRLYIPAGIFLLLTVFVLGGLSGYFYSRHHENLNALAVKSLESEDIYVGFADEIYDKIKENYWDKVPDDQLSALFKLAAEKVLGSPQTLESANKEGMEKMILRAIRNLDDKKKKEVITQIADVVLANLQPFSRSRLYTTKQTQDLRDTVENKDTGINLYSVLGVGKDATPTEISSAYNKKAAELAPEKNTDEGKKKLAELDRSYQALSAPESRKTYDESGVEPTIISKLISPSVFYIQIKRFSPSTLDEFQKAANLAPNNESLNSLILDLRGNIGGAIDILPYILGPFIGQDQYAYEFFHQGDYTPFKTKTGWLTSLVKYKKVVVLIDGETQSSAEVMAAVLKKYNVGILVGSHTKGWGTVEQVLSVDHQISSEEKYSMLLAHSLTLRDDRQPIEGRGVDPAVNIKNSGWENQLAEYFNYPALIKAVKELISGK